MNNLVVDFDNLFWIFFYKHFNFLKKQDFETNEVISETVNETKNETEKELNDEEKFRLFLATKESVKNCLKSFEEKFEIDKIFLCCDSKAYFRKELIKSYKTTRKKTSLTVLGREFYEDILNILKKNENSYILKFDNAEADDVAFFLAKILAKKNENVFLISNDNDWVQILQFNKEKIKLFDPVKNKEKFLEEDIDEYILKKAIIGDKSDNIKGIEGIGVKKLPKFLEKLKEDNEQTKEIWKRINLIEQVIDIRLHPFSEEIEKNIKNFLVAQ